MTAGMENQRQSARTAGLVSAELCGENHNVPHVNDRGTGGSYERIPQVMPRKR